MTMSPAYLVAMAKSYAGQDKGFTIPASEGVTELELGFQPVGMSVTNIDEGVDVVAVTAYFEPAVCLMVISTLAEGSGLDGRVNWIRGADHGTESVRLFPGRPTFGDKDRAQTVVIHTDDTLWVSRNGEREFFVLSPPKDNGRRIVSDKFSLPPWGPDGRGKQSSMDHIHAAYFEPGGYLHTIESDPSLGQWHHRAYFQHEDRGWMSTNIGRHLPAWRYGFANQAEYVNESNSPSYWTIDDYRAEGPKKGLWHGDQLILPSSTIKTASGHDGLCGNGLAFLSNGDLLISRYGQGYPGAFNGIPGAILHVPAALLKHNA